MNRQGETRVWKPFDIGMRIVSTLLGIAMVLMGVVWMLQGLNLAFRVGFMVGDLHWTVYGAIRRCRVSPRPCGAIRARAGPETGILVCISAQYEVTSGKIESLLIQYQ